MTQIATQFVKNRQPCLGNSTDGLDVANERFGGGDESIVLVRIGVSSLFSKQSIDDGNGMLVQRSRHNTGRVVVEEGENDTMVGPPAGHAPGRDRDPWSYRGTHGRGIWGCVEQRGGDPCIG